ncbi:MAG: hypothetical protein QXU90_00490 [Acidilobaceae archaeon]
MSEEEIKILMAREIVEDICGSVDDLDERSKCRSILHKILVNGTGLEELTNLSEDTRIAIRERLRELFEE